MERLRQQAEEEDALAAAEQQREPACWDWPVTDQHRERAGHIFQCEDIGDAYEAATRLLRDWQAGRCAVCGGMYTISFLDHDHATALIRGRLCKSCNTLEGFAGGTGVFALYRTQNPATMLGVQMRYYSNFTGWAEPDRTAEEKFQNSIAAADAFDDIYGGAP